MTVLQHAQQPQDVTAQVIAAFDPHARHEAPSRASSKARNGATSASEERSAAPSLGKERKSTSTPSQTAKDPNAEHSQRNRRFRLQRVAGDLLNAMKKPLPGVGNCGRKRRKDAPQALPIRQGDNGSAYVGNLQRCGSVAACPVCSSRIATERKEEAVKALTAWRQQGGHTYMLTLTVPHWAGQSLAQVMAVVTSSYTSFSSGRSTMKSALMPYGYIGQIRTVEVTHGKNGWHPHLHILVMTERAVPAELVDVFKARWEAAVIAKGWAPPGWAHGVTWQGGDKAAAYVNKSGTWGMAEELTMGNVSKTGGEKGRTPFELLQDAALGCAESGQLFQEYARVTHGRRQQVWSRGLKQRFGLGEKTDQEVVESDEKPTDTVLAEIQPDDWRLVCRYEERAELLRAATSAGQVGVDLMLQWLHQRQRDDKWKTIKFVA